MSGFLKFYFRPAKGEWIHTVVSSDDETCSGIHGRVEERGVPVPGALALLFRADGEKTGKPISAAITDEEGDFVFGPLGHGELYVVKIFRDEVKLREVEITIDN